VANLHYLQIGPLSKGSFSSTLILGELFFQHNVVVHNLSDSHHVQVGLAKKNEKYMCTTPNSATVKKSDDQLLTLALQKYEFPVVNLNYSNMYYLDLSVGSPDQFPFEVLLDTGSATLLVGSQARPSPGIIFWAVLSFCTLTILALPCIIYFACKVRAYKKRKEIMMSSSREEREALLIN